LAEVSELGFEQLFPDSSLNLLADKDVYLEHLYELLNGSAVTLFQSRKLLVRLEIPEDVRYLLYQRYGQEVKELFKLVDGSIAL
jgi:hypothetical protein